MLILDVCSSSFCSRCLLFVCVVCYSDPMRAAVRGPYKILRVLQEGAVAVLATGATQFKPSVTFNRHVSPLASTSPSTRPILELWKQGHTRVVHGGSMFGLLHYVVC
jgi:hypothetical protein